MERLNQSNGLKRVVIGVDPAISMNLHSAETGIIVGGIDDNGIGYVLDDLSGKYGPSQWAEKVIEAYHCYKADRVVAEINQGGDLVEHTLRLLDDSVSFKSVRATRGKFLRAEPIVALYEQKRVFHVKAFEILEAQMCKFTGTSGQMSDRMDALVWALTDLMLTKKSKGSSVSVWSL